MTVALRLGFLVNPIAGIGGPAAYKGSDTHAHAAAERGYAPTAPAKAERFLRRLKETHRPGTVHIFAAPGVLGGDEARAAGWKVGTLGPDSAVHDPFATDAHDTQAAAAETLGAEMDLVVFVGGDGTARDVAQAIGDAIPVLGVPAGVKMFSECFAETPEEAALLVAELARDFAEGDRLDAAPAEVLDLDEEAYRSGRIEVLHHASVRIPRSPRVRGAKCPACDPGGLDEAVGEIALRMREAPDGLFLIGSGSTTGALKAHLGLDGTLIGVDAVQGTATADGVRWEVAAPDADAATLERLVDAATTAGRPVTLVLSPIGGQGFIIGRGTAQLTPKVLAAALPDRLWVLATLGKLATLEDGRLHIDTGDPALDAAFPAYLRVIVGLERERLVPVRKAGTGPEHLI